MAMATSSPWSCGDQLGVPAGGRLAAAVGVVAVGQARTGGPSPAMVEDIAFNAQAVTVAAQVVAAKASWRAEGGPSATASAWPARCQPSECRGRRAGLARVAPVGQPRAGAAARGRGVLGDGRDAGPPGVGGRPAPDGPVWVICREKRSKQVTLRPIRMWYMLVSSTHGLPCSHKTIN